MWSRKRAAEARRRAVALAFGLVSIGLLGFVTASGPLVRAADVTLVLHGRFMPPTGWSLTPGNETDPGPSRSANFGDRVTMQLTSDDGMPHIFWIDYNGNGVIDAGEPESPQFTGTILYTFDALRAGTFTYWCAIHAPSMRGAWVTNASTDSTPPTISAVAVNPDPQVPGGTVNISAQATDNVAVANVSVHILGPSFDANLTMTRLGPSSFYLSRAFMNPGTYAYTVWARDATGNVQSRQGSFEIAVQPPPGVDSVTWLLVGGLIAAAALAIGVFFWRRGRLRSREPPR